MSLLNAAALSLSEDTWRWVMGAFFLAYAGGLFWFFTWLKRLDDALPPPDRRPKVEREAEEIAAAAWKAGRPDRGGTDPRAPRVS